MGCMQDRGNAEKCPHCGWREGSPPDSPLQLAPRTVLNGCYLIGRALGQGGFGITYLAWDLNLDRKLALKEYFPRDLCTRARDECTVQALTQNIRDSYESGRKQFLDEGRALARFQDHPGIVSVLAFFQENGTAYIVMGYMEGQTFKQYLEERGGKIGFEAALTMLTPLMDTLKEVHAVGMLHRDISPDNIYVTRSGQMKLLDFGNARFAIGEQSRSLDVILKPGYAPYEQYRSRGKQGPWTDVYALGATMYRAMTGQTPSPAPDRMAHEDLIPPSRLGVTIPPRAESALLAALALRQEDRPQSVADLKSALLGAQEVAPPRPSPPRPSPPRPSPPPPVPPLPVPPGSPVKVVLWASAAVLVVIAALWLFWPRPKPGQLAVTASIDGVQVSISGPSEASCVTPCDLKLPAGDYHLVGTKPGYHTVERRATIAAGRDSSINLRFELLGGNPPVPSPGHLAVAANVVGAQVAINGQNQNCATPCDLDLPPGDYRVAGAKPGYRGDELTVQVAAGQNPPVNLQLTPLNPPAPPRPPDTGVLIKARIDQGYADVKNGKYDEAISAFRGALSFTPGPAEAAQAHRGLCGVLGRKKEWGATVQECRAAIRLDPKDAGTHMELGVALGNLGDWDGTVAEEQIAVKLEPSYALAHFNLGLALRAKGDHVGAAEECKRARELDPHLKLSCDT
jgi:serine/threonine protein kinase